MSEIDNLGNAITDGLVTYLLSECNSLYPDKNVCKKMQDDYTNCNICADEIVLTVFPILKREKSNPNTGSL